MHPLLYFLFFFFNDTATTEIYTLSLHDALPISGQERIGLVVVERLPGRGGGRRVGQRGGIEGGRRGKRQDLAGARIQHDDGALVTTEPADGRALELERQR